MMKSSVKTSRQRFKRIILLPMALLPLFLLNGLSKGAEQPRRPRIGIVLSGGGARGAAHAGVLKVFEELRIPIDYVTGTSMGSAVGGLYASGLSAAELKDFFENFDWAAGFSDNPPRSGLSFRRKEDDKNFLVGTRMGVRRGAVVFPKGMVEGQNFITELRTRGAITHDIESFDELPIPFRCMASDIVTGESVVLSSGNLAMAIRASVAIPPLFSPVEYQGRLLVDGGYLNNIPVDVARAMGADIVIVVNIGTPLALRTEIQDVFDVVGQAGRLGGTQFDRQQIGALKSGDVLIVPDLTGLSFVDFDKIPAIINIGEKTARAMADQLKRLSVSEKDYQAYLRSRKPRAPANPVIHRIEIHNGARIADRLVLRMISQKTGQPLDSAQLQKDLAHVYGLGNFELVDYNVTEKDGVNTLVVTAPEKSWGPGNLKFGLSLTDDFRNDSRHALSFRYTQTDMNSLGAEVQSNGNIGTNPSIDLELLQPIDYQLDIFHYGAPLFVAPRVSYESKLQPVTVGSEQVAEYRVKTPSVGFDVGHHFSNVAELRLGVERAWSEAKKEVGTDGPSSVEWDNGDYRAKVTVDTLNRVIFPGTGSYGILEYRNGSKTLGATREYSTVNTEWMSFKELKNHNINVAFKYSTNLDQGTPTPRIYTLGGLLNMSAFTTNELVGGERIYARLGHYWNPGRLMGKKIFLGDAVEWGNTWMKKEDINYDSGNWDGVVYVGMKTPIGPVYIAHSRGTRNHFATWFVLGTLF